MKIITITGQDGAGKTTLQKQLLSYIDSRKLGEAIGMHLPYSDFVHRALKISGDSKPFGDTYTDRLIFAVDNHLTAYRMRDLAEDYQFLVAQRGWMDSFIHGAVQGYSYEQTANLNRVAALPTSYCSIYLNCDSEVAYQRLKNDPNKDKFETPLYLARQEVETRRFYEGLHDDPLVSNLFTEPTLYIDTTQLSQSEVYAQVLTFLEQYKAFAVSADKKVVVV